MESGAFVDEMEELINGGSAPVVAAGSASAAVPLTAGAAAAPGAAILADVAAPVAVAGAGAGACAGAVRAMRWTNNTSGFVLRRMAALVSDGNRPDKVFKDKDVNDVVKALKEYCGEIVTSTQVYNHLRKWRQTWYRVSKLKDLSGALWDDDTHAIMLKHEHYLGHCKVAN
jgi:hypothetical protein